MDSNIPGPAPWYLKDIKFDSCFWEQIPFPKYLIKPLQSKILGVEKYTYIKKLGENRLLAWHDFKKRNSIEFVVLNIKELEEITLTPTIFAGCEFISNTHEKIVLDKNFTESEYGITPCDLDSVCVLSDNTDRFDLSNVDRAIYDIDFRIGKVKVVHIEWFNKGNIDFGYQWITRIEKISDDKYCGEGFRIDPFYMNNKGQRI